MDAAFEGRFYEKKLIFCAAVRDMMPAFSVSFRCGREEIQRLYDPAGEVLSVVTIEEGAEVPVA